MLTQVAEGVLVHQSEFVRSNAVVVRGGAGVLLVDAGIDGAEMACLANDLAGQRVVAGFSTHPHWDHLLWHADFGSAPRYGTAVCAATVQERLSGGVEAVAKAAGVPEGVPLDLLGQITGLPTGAARIPWDGPEVRVIEHQAHAPGHAALVVGERGVLVAGDMLSDVLVPMLDLSSADPIGDYLTALELLEEHVGVVIPGHGSVGGADEARARIDLDRAYLNALRDGRVASDPRIGPSGEDGWEWVAGVHERQLQRLTRTTGLREP
ncbi:MBL fold metallo-hydrolase [Kibdelosporangium lantanae]